ncbi:hypothetical protein HK105_206919 [Polyrhizophydium stewartii]|uniref:Uncharacterized protein n=1 Tax=Polyrhizophydium stewartii TaxID=2732419 RepID=A0ABR4N252_9FUNG
MEAAGTLALADSPQTAQVSCTTEAIDGSVSAAATRAALGSSSELKDAVQKLAETMAAFSGQATECERMYKSQAEVRRLVTDRQAFQATVSAAQETCVRGVADLADQVTSAVTILERIWGAQASEIERQTGRLRSSVEVSLTSQHTATCGLVSLRPSAQGQHDPGPTRSRWPLVLSLLLTLPRS